MLFKTTENYKEAEWEEIPDEELWQDGEINTNQLKYLLYIRIIQEGDWKVMRRSNGYQR